MPSTFLSLHYHIVFSTKERRPFIEQEWKERLYDYLGGTIRGLRGFPEGIGGTMDHVHLLIGLKATHRLCDVIRDLKKTSSTWIHDTLARPDFFWQEGYAAFSVSSTSRISVQQYIKNQVNHHRRRTYREELITMLTTAGISFEEQYLD